MSHMFCLFCNSVRSSSMEDGKKMHVNTYELFRKERLESRFTLKKKVLEPLKSKFAF